MGLGGFAMWALLLCYGCCCMVSYNIGGIEAKRLSNVDDLEIEEKLKLINKPAIKIIKTIYGDRYGCVDFYKQPGFDHSSLKNHKFHYKMQPISNPEGRRQRKMSNITFGYLWKNGKGCPIGTVPIRRVTREELIQINSFTIAYNSQGSPNIGRRHFAVARTTGKGRSYNGAQMDVSLYNPSVKPGQFSSTRMHIQIGDDFIQTGWTVNPLIFSDNRTRQFIYTKAGGTGCFNTLCPGFITVRQDIPLGVILQPMSVRGKTSYIDNFAIFKDAANGNWWLEIFGGQEVGFWPASRFRMSSGTDVEWGGEVYSRSLPSPPMGNGHFPVGNIKYDAFICRIAIVDGNYKTDRKVKNTEAFSDDSNGYKVRDTTTSWWKNVGHLIVFGGPGNI